jgi:hypothetical protein
VGGVGVFVPEREVFGLPKDIEIGLDMAGDYDM